MEGSRGGAQRAGKGGAGALLDVAQDGGGQHAAKDSCNRARLCKAHARGGGGEGLQGMPGTLGSRHDQQAGWPPRTKNHPGRLGGCGPRPAHLRAHAWQAARRDGQGSQLQACVQPQADLHNRTTGVGGGGGRGSRLASERARVRVQAGSRALQPAPWELPAPHSRPTHQKPHGGHAHRLCARQPPQRHPAAHALRPEVGLRAAAGGGVKVPQRAPARTSATARTAGAHLARGAAHPGDKDNGVEARGGHDMAAPGCGERTRERSEGTGQAGESAAWVGAAGGRHRGTRAFRRSLTCV